MEYLVLLHPRADRFLGRCNSPLKERIRQGIRELKKKPDREGGRLSGSVYYTIRIGDYRVIYAIWHDEGKVVVLYIGHRRKVYDDFDKLF